MLQFLKRLWKFLLIGMVPIALLLLGYLYFDPFKTLRPYADYSYPYVVPNRDYISTEAFLHREKQNQYNAFIFGSSRTLGFRPDSWRKYLPDTAHPFVFDASAESIFGIYTKLKLIDSMKVPINNALLVFCRDVTFRTDKNSTGLLYIKHPATSGESKLAFQWSFLKAYLSPRFLFSFYTYEFTHKYRPFMKEYIEKRRIVYDKVSNEITILDQDEAIAKNPEQYYAERKQMFSIARPERTDSIARINANMKQMLDGIRAILDRNHTAYKIVLSPLYERVHFNPADKQILEHIFPQHVCDYTGNNQFTSSMYNYYESNHFRPAVGDSILAQIYR
ncbi:MAG TPA: hypothetical protein PKJ36_02115 [Flavihumibacter sp.]|nr:hypothetical protein [Flavihumibacter sp.]